MIAKNNYYWTEKYKEMDFIANGEIAVVRRVRRTREIYGFRFAEVTLRFPDQNDFELDANLLLDTLHSDSPALPKEDNDRLFYTVLEDYIDIPNKRDRMKKMKADPHYNALQVKYAYAITCHKAQGGNGLLLCHLEHQQIIGRRMRSDLGQIDQFKSHLKG